MRLTNFVIGIWLLLVCVACSGDSAQEVTVDKAQQVYNEMKGTYVGGVWVDNTPRSVTIVVDNEFTVRQLPLKPILSRVFLDASSLSEALTNNPNVVFTAPTKTMNIIQNSIMLVMEPTELLLKIDVQGKTYHISAQVETVAYRNSLTGYLTVNMDVTELTCNGETYDLSISRINYLIEDAVKQ